MQKFDVIVARKQARSKTGYMAKDAHLHVRIDQKGILALTDYLSTKVIPGDWDFLLTDYNLAMLAVLRGKKFQEAYEYYQRKAGIIK